MSALRRMGTWLKDRWGLGGTVRRLARHPVPPESRWLYVFGSATLFAFLLQAVSGAALATLYVPSTGGAYDSLQFITRQAPLGNLLRGMHYFGASAMIVLVIVHLVRVFLTAAYKFPREMSWLTGSVLLLLTLGFGFTGQLLRWDQNAVWSVVVGAEQAGRTPWLGDLIARFVLGGETLGSDTLSRFFALHVFVLPATLLLLVGYHLFLVLHNGISEPPVAGRPVRPTTYRSWYRRQLDDRGVPFWPDAGWRDAVFGALVVGVVIGLAFWLGPPPLDKPPDPSLVKAHPRPDWYFLFYFALLALMPHGLEDYVIILGPLLVGVVLVLVPLVAARGERAPTRRPWSVALVVGGLTIVGALTVAGVHANWSPDFGAKPLAPDVVASSDPNVQQGAHVFYERACIYCHRVGGQGGRRGPELSSVGDLLTQEEMVIRVLNGGYNMPGYGAILKPEELDAVVAFLQSRR